MGANEASDVRLHWGERVPGYRAVRFNRWTRGEKVVPGRVVIAGERVSILAELVRTNLVPFKLVYIDLDVIMPDITSEVLGESAHLFRLCRELLTADGSAWIAVDDRRCHYAKVMLDDVFGRANFVMDVIVARDHVVGGVVDGIAVKHEHLLVYQRESGWRANLLPRSAAVDRIYHQNVDARGPFRPDNYTLNIHRRVKPNNWYPIRQPNLGVDVFPKEMQTWKYIKSTHDQHVRDGMIYWGIDGRGMIPMMKRYLHELHNDGLVPESMWVGSGAMEKLVTVATTDSDRVLDMSPGRELVDAVVSAGRRYLKVIDVGGERIKFPGAGYYRARGLKRVA